MFESVEEVDQIETEPKTEEAKQAPKMPNGALQNGTCSPDSGHPSSRNFSVTSGLSDTSLSTDDTAVPDAAQRSAAAPPASQSSVKPAGAEGEGVTEETLSQERTEVKDEEETPGGTITAENTKIEVNDDDMIQPLEEEQVMTDKETCLQTESQENVEEPESTKTEGTESEDTDIQGIQSLDSGEIGRDVSDQDNVTVSAAATESKEELVERSLKKDVEVRNEETTKLEERIEEKMKEMDESNTSEPQEFSLTEGTEKMVQHLVAADIETNLLFSTDTRVSRTRESQKEEPQVMTESDESPSAIEMEEIPKAKVSMVPWSRKGRCEPSSSFEDSAPHAEEEPGKPSPEGTESILSEEPEMESLYPHFDSLPGSGDTKSKATSQGSAGGTFSVSSHVYIYIYSYTFMQVISAMNSLYSLSSLCLF